MEIMIAIKRVCKFFDQCQIASAWSIICSERGGDACGLFRMLSLLEKEKRKNGKEKEPER